MCASKCLLPLGIDDLSKQNLCDVGTDGASVNFGEIQGMKGVVQSKNPWIMWSWCYAHRLELACKNALASSLFKCIEDMLLRLYYLYEKSPKKIRDLEEIVTDLQHVFDLGPGAQACPRFKMDHTQKKCTVTCY